LSLGELVVKPTTDVFYVVGFFFNAAIKEEWVSEKKYGE
jgi:hypothetical protein